MMRFVNYNIVQERGVYLNCRISNCPGEMLTLIRVMSIFSRVSYVEYVAIGPYFLFNIKHLLFFSWILVGNLLLL